MHVAEWQVQVRQRHIHEQRLSFQLSAWQVKTWVSVSIPTIDKQRTKGDDVDVEKWHGRHRFRKQFTVTSFPRPLQCG